jgi:hypothetical protein
VCVEGPGEIRIHGPRLKGFLAAIWWDPWNPLDVLIDGEAVGRVATCETAGFPVARGEHGVQVRWSRAHHLRSRPVLVDVRPDATVELELSAIRVMTVGIPSIRLIEGIDGVSGA